MATQELRKRANWQTISGAKALRTEELFQFSLQSALDEVYPNKFIVDRHPKEFGNIYSTYPLSQEVREKYMMSMLRKRKLMVNPNMNGE